MLRLGLIPSVDPATMTREAQPFVQSLCSSLGLEMEAVVPDDYDAVGRGLLDGNIDIGFIGPAGYVVAKDRLNAPVDPVARGVLDVGGSAWGRAIVVVHAGARIETVEDLRGKSFAFSDPVSTSGYFIPYRALAGNGVNPETDLRETRFTGSLALSLGQVADGTVDAAGIGDEILALAIHRGELKASGIRTIYESEPVPGSLFVVRNTLQRDLLERIKCAILAMRDMPFCKVGLIRSMEPAADGDYDIVREQLREFERCFASCRETTA